MWGNSLYGGDYSKVRAELEKYDICHVGVTCRAFTAITSTGLAVSWGDSAEGGDNSRVKDQLTQAPIVAIFGNGRSFMAINKTGSTILWGNVNYGANNNSVKNQLESSLSKDIKSIINGQPKNTGTNTPTIKVILYFQICFFQFTNQNCPIIILF